MKINMISPVSYQKTIQNDKKVNFSANVNSEMKAVGNAILENEKNLNSQIKAARDKAPKYLEKIGKIFKKASPKIDKIVNNDNKTIEDLVNFGNIAKEAVCMVVYPLQVLTNPDLSKDKRRFVGFYDFYVTCFSLLGTVLYAWKGGKIMKAGANSMLKKTLKGKVVPNVEKAIDGGAFVLGIAIQTILFKRVIAPALSPPLAAKTRRFLEKRDETNSIKNKENAPAESKKTDK